MVCKTCRSQENGLIHLATSTDDTEIAVGGVELVRLISGQRNQGTDKIRNCLVLLYA